jgi:hypothetical protein
MENLKPIPSGQVCTAVRYSCLLIIAAALSACTGSWAKTTFVSLKPLQASRVRGDAYVNLSVACGYCQPRPGSEITVALSGAVRANERYSLVLANGSCSDYAGDGDVIASGSGRTFSAVVRTHIDTRIDVLTSRDYLLVIRNGARRAVACGKIYDPSLF